MFEDAEVVDFAAPYGGLLGRPPVQTNAMFTNVEGEWDEIMPMIRACIDKATETAPRLTVTIKLDWRPGQAAGRLSPDLESVERRLR